MDADSLRSLLGAISSLVDQLNVVAGQLARSAHLDADDAAVATNDTQFAVLRRDLLAQAGGGLSLTEAAALLGVTRQALHKRVKAGSALGIMDGRELVLPRVQFVTVGGTTKPIPGLADIVRLFAVAGGWSALQFLLEPDPNVGGRPIDALAEGRARDVLDAARAYLDTDEG